MTMIDRENITAAAALSSVAITWYISDVLAEAERRDRKAMKRYGVSQGVSKYCLRVVFGDARDFMRGLYNVVS